MSDPARLPDREEWKALVQAALADFVPSCEGRIHVGRAWPQQGQGVTATPQFPALLVEDGPRLHRLAATGFVELRLQLRILARVQHNDDAVREALLDEIEMQIRDAVFTSALLKPYLIATEEMASEREVSMQGQATIGQDAHLVTFRFAGFV
jgi:hypothetical protein